VVIRDAEWRSLFFFARVTDKNFRDIHSGHAGAALRDEPRVVPFAAADIEAFQAFHGRHDRLPGPMVRYRDSQSRTSPIGLSKALSQGIHSRTPVVGRGRFHRKTGFENTTSPEAAL
jgi:hypothetical protein